MPQVPSPLTVPAQSIGPGTPRVLSGIRQAVEQAAAPLQQIAAQEVERSQTDEFLTLSTELEERLTDLRFQIERDPSLASETATTQAFTQGAEPILEEISGRARWDANRTALEARGSQSLLRGAVAARSLGIQRETDAAIASVDRSQETYVRSYATRELEADRMAALKDYEVAVSLAEERGYLTAQQAEGRRQDFRRDAARQRAIELINQGRLDEAERFIRSSEAQGVLDPTDLYSLTSSLSVRRSQNEAALKGQRKLASDAIKQNVVQRIFGAGQPITMAEILSLPLDAEEKEHYAELLQNQVYNPSLDKDNPLVVRSLIDQIDSGDIDDPIQLHLYLMNGLSRATEGILRQRIEDRKKPDEKYLSELIQAHFRQAQKQISRGTIYESDALGAKKYNEYYFDKMEEIRQMKEAGSSMKELREALDPSSPTYIGKDLDSYKITWEEYIKQFEQEASGARPAPPPGHPDWESTGKSIPVFRTPDGREVIFNE